MNLLVKRQYQGLGDWIMAMSALKLVHLRYPDLHVNISPFAGKANLTSLICGIVETFDHGYLWSTAQQQHNRVIEHLGYPTSTILAPTHKHIIQSMVETINGYLPEDMNVPYRPGVYSKYIGMGAPHIEQELPPNYILMPSMGRSIRREGKEWGTANFQRLATLFRDAGFTIVQIGQDGAPVLPEALKVYRNVDVHTMYSLFRRCKFFVGMVNGLACFSGVHGIKTYAIYAGISESFERSWFPNQTPLPDGHPEDVFNAIMFREAEEQKRIYNEYTNSSSECLGHSL